MEWFGVVDEQQQPPCAIGRVSALYDVLNHLVVDAQLAPYRLGERDLALLHLPYVDDHDVLLFDRGYPAFWLLAWLHARGRQFCMRANVDYSPAIVAFVHSGDAERTLEIAPSDPVRRACRRQGLSTQPVRVRVVRVDLGGGGVEVLFTSLEDAQQYPHEIFGELYHQRWGIEEGYKFLKCRVEIENFSGKSVHAVMQDFHAKIVTGNLTALGAYQAQRELPEAPHRPRVRVNFSHALASLKHTLVRLLTAANPVPVLMAYLDLLGRTVEIVRPGRSVPRRLNQILPPRFRMTYKRCG
jgi:hypothetical protein